MSFSASGKSHASKATELPGLQDNYLSSEESDGNRSGNDDVVALIQQQTDKTSRKKPSRPRENKKWSLSAVTYFMSVIEHRHVFLYTSCRRGVESPTLCNRQCATPL